MIYIAHTYESRTILIKKIPIRSKRILIKKKKKQKPFQIKKEKKRENGLTSKRARR